MGAKYPATKCFLVEPTSLVRRFARCYVSGPDKCDKSGVGYHNAEVFVDEVESPLTPEGYDDIELRLPLPDDAPWPVRCSCGLEFALTDRHMFSDRLYKRVDTGELIALRDIEKAPGAIYRATWMEPHWVGKDGRSYVAVCPNGRLWQIDGPCNNCTRKGEPHLCWIRDGEPPIFTVGKGGPSDNTCSAGGGSILAGDYHGFLQNGWFTQGD